MTARVNPHRRLNGETVSLVLAIPASDGKMAQHPLDVSLMYDKAGTLREVVFVGRGKIGHGLDLLLHDLGIKLSRAIQGRDPDTGAPQGRGSVGDTSPQTGTSP